MKLNLLLTGNELMAGDIIDSNSAMIAEQFKYFGWRINKKVTVGDDLALLCEEIDQLCTSADVLIINGGLGPTVDDLTAVALAKVTNTEIAEHPDALAHLTQWCAKRGYGLNSSNHKQAMLPKGCEIIANARGSAVGIKLKHRGCLIFATPGVPSELRPMLTNEITPILEGSYHSDHIETLRLGAFGLGESAIQELVNEHLGDWPEDIELGFRASMPVLEVKLTARGELAKTKLPLWRTKVGELLGDHLLGELPISLPSATVAALKEHNLQICTAESCTGGLIASQLTGVPGASQVFPGAIVSYSNAVKHRLLSVSEADLAKEGAVSEAVVRQMALGAIASTGADLAIAVTGIAGPDGGTPEKPVGTVWIAWGTADQLKSQCFHLPFERNGFQNWVAALSLDLVRRYILKLPEGSELMKRYQR
ncbi:CinA family nicotinamide mononucleotide deamidase-related protein [Zhongshania sp.]|uniref:CinA family nicotinamide mononucleotide deamidase-related protein n=1 Tax=Zhongshania sp. TaxID=1971902 RepID=UPI00356224D7